MSNVEAIIAPDYRGVIVVVTVPASATDADTAPEPVVAVAAARSVTVTVRLFANAVVVIPPTKLVEVATLPIVAWLNKTAVTEAAPLAVAPNSLLLSGAVFRRVAVTEA
jgi:hypothetical protein